jgi:ABC-type amino acid transport system permease subunit
MGLLLVAVSVGTPIFVVMFLLFFVVPKFAQQKPYLKRVAKKYSIPPLDLR